MRNSGNIYDHKNTTLNIVGNSSTTTIESETGAPVAQSSITGTTPLNISTDFEGDDADVKINFLILLILQASKIFNNPIIFTSAFFVGPSIEETNECATRSITTSTFWTVFITLSESITLNWE